MFFTKAGQVVAWLAFVAGLLRVVMGLVLAVGFDDPIEASRRYMGSGKLGEEIDQGIYVMLVGIAFGILTEISKAQAARKE